MSRICCDMPGHYDVVIKYHNCHSLLCCNVLCNVITATGATGATGVHGHTSAVAHTAPWPPMPGRTALCALKTRHMRTTHVVREYKRGGIRRGTAGARWSLSRRSCVVYHLRCAPATAVRACSCLLVDPPSARGCFACSPVRFSPRRICLRMLLFLHMSAPVRRSAGADAAWVWHDVPSGVFFSPRVSRAWRTSNVATARLKPWAD